MCTLNQFEIIRVEVIFQELPASFYFPAFIILAIREKIILEENHGQISEEMIYQVVATLRVCLHSQVQEGRNKD